MLAGDLSCESGEFFVSADTRIGYLKQDGGFDSQKTVIEEAEAVFSDLKAMETEMKDILDEAEKLTGKERDEKIERYDVLHERYRDRGGYTYKSEITGILSSMAFGEDSCKKKISTLSGGEKTRLALACLLLKKPDILFLDEPTNHLDIGTLKWLEQYLKGYMGTIVLVSHDRYFLDETVTRIFEIENHKLSIYEGNYTFYASERKKRREADLKRYEKQQKEISRQEDMIRRFKERGTEKLAKRAASREKRLVAMERIDRPEGEKGRMKLSFRENFKSGNDVLLAENLSKSFGYGSSSKKLFEHVELDIKRGERVCIVGANGIGKTTLLRMLMGELTADTGRIKIGYNVQAGYYDQGQQRLNSANTVIDELHDAYRLYTDTELRNILGRFLFRGESVFLEVGALSGGERARLALLKLMLSGANLLMLDEPTNHLDIESKEVFEEALMEFPGTCIIVSHDRYFLNRIPTRIVELTSEGTVSYLGKYDYYEEKRRQTEEGGAYLRQMAENEKRNGSSSCGSGLSSAEQRRLQKEREAEERRLIRRKDSLEKDIQAIENDIKSLEEQVSLEENMTDHVKLAEISGALEEKRDILEEKYEEWLRLQE